MLQFEFLIFIGVAAVLSESAMLGPEMSQGREIQSVLEEFVFNLNATAVQKSSELKLLQKIDYSFPATYENECLHLNKLDLKSYLYIDGKLEPIIMKYDDEVASEFDPKKETKLFIHCWLQDGWHHGTDLANAYRLKKGVNFIIFDWSKYSKCRYISQPTIVIPKIGEAVKDMLEKYMKVGLDLQKLQLIGFGMGAHIAGYSSRNLNNNVERITALDAAGPIFNILPIHLRLNKDDAKFVLSIHTNYGFFGIQKEIGHVDVYMNDGKIQPGCLKSNYCSHIRALEYWSETVYHSKNNDFYARKCSDWNEFDSGCARNEEILLNDMINSNTSGIFYVRTNYYSPYGVGKHLPMQSFKLDV